MSINPLSIEDLLRRKDEVVEAHNEAMNDLEQKYFSDVTQLYRIKQAMQSQLQRSLMDSLNEINTMIKQKITSQSSCNGHSRRTRHKTPSFPLQSIHRPTPPLPIPSIPAFNHPMVPLSASIDAVLLDKHNIRSNYNGNSNNYNNYSNGNSNGINYNNTEDVIFNLVTLPDDILNDVKSIMKPNRYNTNDKKNIKDIKGKPDTLECSLCHQAFDTEKNLEAHLNSAHSFKCDLCSKSFQEKIDLKRHQRIHEGVKVFECKICYKTYRFQSTLNNHMRIHEVSNLFTCSYCNKGFTNRHHLKRHLRIHTGVTPFKCRYCGRPFKYNTSCTRHERTVHKDLYKPRTSAETIADNDEEIDRDTYNNSNNNGNKRRRTHQEAIDQDV